VGPQDARGLLDDNPRIGEKRFRTDQGVRTRRGSRETVTPGSRKRRILLVREEWARRNYREHGNKTTIII